ncbi:Putative sulfatase-modifying factor enzyme, C-type lectin [Septoria linicola]|uniref:Sulfatase-modifying factor enzyme, C-type lectin n=1 Tax=Septoria linicola TaxID=215465 RepID=A0A9Q9B3M6_9PEZI|nr:putative sulfatase-modifying factor enzyme, C-type lectin [Septoria linicola]USW56923.1 Putative sulfatase-modifying factor enzyme, C-type lectin [Septoria linicola]
MGSIPQVEKTLRPDIIDIRSDTAGIELKQLIHSGLQPEDGSTEKTLPTLLLYDNKGLKLFEEITYLEQYYLTGEEIKVLEASADQIAERIPTNALVVELGSGNLRKVKILLDALERAGKSIEYYALDLMQSELERTLAAVPKDAFKHVQCYGLWGTYDDGLEWLKRSDNAARPKAILSLGSSIGNFPRDDAVGFIAQFADTLKPTDSFVLGLDACQNPDRVYHAYNDKDDVTHNFTMNGLHHANTLLGKTAFNIDDWEAIGEYDQIGERHRAFVVPKRDVEVEGIAIKRGEKVRIEESYKYNNAQALQLWSAASVIESAGWTNEDGSYALHMLTRPATMYPTKPEEYAATPVPSILEWEQLWAVWDKVTRQMIPNEELLEKPIKLRNACIFYLGHIPTFFDIKINEATELGLTEPAYFTKIFERGIDPDVDNPEQCHAHSEIPDEWPPLETILKYQEDVRNRVRDLYKTGRVHKDNWAGRAMWLGFEHEVMHLETLLYMALQSDRTQPPENTIKADFEQLAAKAKRDAVPNEWFTIPAQTVTIGLDDPDTADGPTRHFGWDVEKPAYTTKVASFKATARPITNEDYARYLLDKNVEQIPASWTTQNKRDSGINGQSNGIANGNDSAFDNFISDKYVRTFYGALPLEYTLAWPCSASYDELNGCAQYMGGRIPTMEETRSIHEYAAHLKKKEADKAQGKTIPAVNSHLVNEGVEESPPSQSASNGSSSDTADPFKSKELFVDLGDANVGFKHWHPMPVTQNGHKLAGLGEIGGLWEWTSSVLEKRDGFEPMKLYPAYSADFYDAKHYVVLGGSWATHPRFAGRKSVVNWYQRNYPYVWAGARLVQDL